MKKIFFSFVLFSGLTHQVATAQGTLFLSNLATPPNGNSTIGAGSWWGQDFQTGTNPGGYNLSIVQLLMNSASGSPSGFNLSLYSLPLPNSFIGNLTGSEPLAGGTYTFSASGIHLQASSLYFIVASASSPLSQGTYNWSYGTAPPEVAGWSILKRYHSTDGVNWLIADRSSAFQFAVYATAVPEPSSLFLLAMGGSFLFTRLARKSRSKALRRP